mmetsp:Transcript_38478/g.125149  ORF Transcript_38478/g.125149 Transcript_38478/m.125149 type:complete len:246 (+) Transcript_38478:16-753(+)
MARLRALTRTLERRLVERPIPPSHRPPTGGGLRLTNALRPPLPLPPRRLSPPGLGSRQDLGRTSAAPRPHLPPPLPHLAIFARSRLDLGPSRTLTVPPTSASIRFTWLVSPASDPTPCECTHPDKNLSAWWKWPSCTRTRTVLAPTASSPAGAHCNPSASCMPASNAACAPGRSAEQSSCRTAVYSFHTREVGCSSRLCTPPSVANSSIPVVSRSSRPHAARSGRRRCSGTRSYTDGSRGWRWQM